MPHPLLPPPIDIDWAWLRTVLLGYDTPPLSTLIVPPSGVLLGILELSAAGFLLLLCTASLPLSPRAYPLTALARLGAFPLIAHLCLHAAVSPRITLGAPLRDFVWAIVGWNIGARALDVCVGSYFVDGEDEAQRCPRWIVPRGKERELGKGKAVALAPAGKGKPGATSSASDPAADVPAQWYAIPHSAYPLLSLRRLLWSIDHLLLLRPHTSWLLPGEQRALEWAHRSFLCASGAPAPTSVWEPPAYGAGEDRSLLTILPKLLLFAALGFFSHLAFVPPGLAGYYTAPAIQQVYNVALYGGLIALLPGSLESLLFPLLRRYLRVPSTALIPTFRQPLAARGPADFWGRRWHTFVRRVTWRDARLFPWGDAKKHPWGNKVWAFVISGSLHGAIFARWIALPGSTGTPGPSEPAWALTDPRAWYALAFLAVPGPMAFFLAQGLLVAVDLALQQLEGSLSSKPSPQAEPSPSPKASPQQQHQPQPQPQSTKAATAIRLLRRLLLWSGLAYTGRWFAGSIAATGLHSPEGQSAMHGGELLRMGRELARGRGWW